MDSYHGSATDAGGAILAAAAGRQVRPAAVCARSEEECERMLTEMIREGEGAEDGAEIGMLTKIGIAVKRFCSPLIFDGRYAIV